MIRTAPEGRWFIAGSWAIALALGFAAWRSEVLAWRVGAVCWLAVSVWVVAFFRDPARPWTRDDRLVVAPADGKVVGIVEIDEPTFFCDRAVRISIFMNVFNCHVNRYPTDGTVAFREYHPGRFGHAAGEKASLSNEQASLGLTTSHGKVLVRQIAGLIARRIVTDHRVGMRALQAERLGMIRFGSRVDLFLPLGTSVRARVGDTTQAGVTVVAAWS